MPTATQTFPLAPNPYGSQSGSVGPLPATHPVSGTPGLVAWGGTPSGAGTTPVPPPQYGQPNPYGAVPGPITIPDPAKDLAAQYPNLGSTNQALSSDILSKLSGYLSPSTINAIQNHFGGTFGQTSGMPNSRFSWNNVYGNLIGAAENQRQQGIQDYNATIPTVSGTQTVAPGVQVAAQALNALNASAPNPATAQTYAQQLFNQYMQMLRGPAGGTQRTPYDAAGVTPDFFNPAQGNSNALGFGFGTRGSSGMSTGSSAIGPGSVNDPSNIDDILMNQFWDQGTNIPGGELPASALEDYSYIG